MYDFTKLLTDRLRAGKLKNWRFREGHRFIYALLCPDLLSCRPQLSVRLLLRSLSSWVNQTRRATDHSIQCGRFREPTVALFVLSDMLNIKSSVRTSQETYYVSITEISRLMLCRETNAVLSLRIIRNTNTLCGQNEEF
jgi:hypothetical protein